MARWLADRRRVAELDHARLFDAAGVDAEQSAEPSSMSGCLVEDLDGEAVLGAERDGNVAEVGGGEVAGRGVRQVAGEVRGAARRICPVRMPAVTSSIWSAATTI